jgi:PhzF family phenazine biosynthesis protein
MVVESGGLQILRYAAFSSDPAGGNPAGVVLDARALTSVQMQKIAADIGYSETAFLLPNSDPAAPSIRYFSPLAEVPFCGHATIATAVAYADSMAADNTDIELQTSVGPVRVRTSRSIDGSVATLTSVEPSVAALADSDLAALLSALGWAHDDLDPLLPPRVAYAGAYHPVIAVRTRERLAALEYDFDALGALMAAREWTTVALIFRESELVFHARNPFPPGGVREDPATGAAAAALGGYLRALGQVSPPAKVTVQQGADMNRPGLLTVTIPVAGGIDVSGTAVPIS